MFHNNKVSQWDIKKTKSKHQYKLEILQEVEVKSHSDEFQNNKIIILLIKKY
jgi:hypothetical protein